VTKQQEKEEKEARMNEVFEKVSKGVNDRVESRLN
jgi:hypothetical protein